MPNDVQRARQLSHNTYVMGYYLLFASIARMVDERKKGNL